jgi:hypothetical protein
MTCRSKPRPERTGTPPDAINQSAACPDRLGVDAAQGNASGAVSDGIINLPPLAELGRLWAYGNLSVGYPIVGPDRWPVWFGVAL